MSAKGKKSLCDLEGHDFIATTAPNFRKCRRSGCDGAECLKDGVWVFVSGKGVSRPPKARVTQSVLFHLEASQTGRLRAIEEDWLKLDEEQPKSKTFAEVQAEVVAKMDSFIADRDAKKA